MPKLKKCFSFVSLFILITSCLSFAFEGYYQNIDSRLEFKMIALEAKDGIVEEIPTIHGGVQKVEKGAIIDSSDILGISINSREIKIHFNQNSWNKIRKLTSSINGSKVAFIKNNKVISSLTMVSTLDRVAILPITDGLDLDWFLKGFAFKDPPENLGSEKIYMEFLKKWLVDHQNDTQALSLIAIHYISNDDFSNCEGAIPYLEQILINSPSNFIIGNKLITCFLELGKNERALKTAINLLPNISDDIMKNAIVALIGDIYYQSGMLKKAIKQTEIALNFYKDFKIPALNDWEDTPDLLEKQKNQYRLMKENAISVLEKKINVYKKELNGL